MTDSWSRKQSILRSNVILSSRAYFIKDEINYIDRKKPSDFPVKSDGFLDLLRKESMEQNGKMSPSIRNEPDKFFLAFR